MCHNRTINNKINLLHKRCLRIVHNDNKSSFQELLDKDEVSQYMSRIYSRALAVEIFEVSDNYSTSLMKEIFDKHNNVYDFRNAHELLDEMYDVSSMVQKALLFLVLKSGILYLVK